MIRQALAKRGSPLHASWHTLGVPLGIELAAAEGWDLALIDQQHGMGGNDQLVAQLTAARAAGVPGLVRVAWNDAALVSRALDAGAAGVVVPMVNSAEEAAALVRAAKYPPLGARSWGPYRAALTSSGDYLSDANEATLAFAQIETAAAVEALDGIVATAGIDGLLVGPNDLALSLTGARDIRAPVVLDAMAAVLAACRDKGRLAWIFANDRAYADDRRIEGWDIISIGSDAGWLAAGSRAMLKGTGA
ncbi:MAG: 2,4-dihydroxyhept-2-ene-1,7-dioic acid aldolase [Rhizobiales bacterium]|nr:2,4-dihydroxyhept-2-ene-1,7-dioic acid aldolase [Hyphomicrobiales bacterium]